jgi:ribosomal protein L40E
VQGQSATQDEALKKIADVGPDIHCPYCGARNPGNAKVCLQCGGDLSEGARRAAGQVVGAYASTPARTMDCPRCHTPNPETNLRCTNCGAPLTRPVNVATPAASVSRSRSSWMLYAVVALVLVCLCGAGVWFVSTMARSTDATGSVLDRSWHTVVQIQALTPVQLSGWQDEIPNDAKLGQCETRVREVVDQPPAGAQTNKVCGTPYTLDTGSGVGKVVQDCQYEVMQPYCEYTVMQWGVVQELTRQGKDSSPSYAEAQLTKDQRLGDKSLSFSVIFQTSDNTYTYTPASLEEFQRFTIGSQWILSINGFGQVVDVKSK